MWYVIVIINIFFVFVVKCEDDQSKIIGGVYCDRRKPEINFKFMISLRTYHEDYDFYEHFCGGTLITERTVLTAGHCHKPETMFAVEAYRIDEIEYNGPATKVASRIPHPKFDAKTNHHDIALMLLASPIHKNNKVEFVKLPRAKYLSQDLLVDLHAIQCSSITVMGWGQTTKGDREKWYPLRLKCLDLTLVSLKDCINAHKETKDKFVYDENMCTAASTAVDFWRGDSGGPALCNDVQYGIVSWGYGAQNYPSVYTRVDPYLDFIHENAKGRGSRELQLFYSFFRCYCILFFICFLL